MGYEDTIGMIDLDGMQTENQRLGQEPGKGNGLDKYLNMPEGEGYIEIRLLPPLKGKKLFQALRLHYMNNRKVPCAKELVNGKWVGSCPVCEYYNSLYRKIDVLKKSKIDKTDEIEKLEEEARSVKPVDRYYYNSIERKRYSQKTKKEEINDKPEPKILSVGKKLHKAIVTAIVGDEAAGEMPLGNITDLKVGRDFKIVKKDVKGSDGKVYPNYDQSKFVDPAPAGTKEQIETWLSTMHELVNERKTRSEEELRREIAVHRGLIKDESVGFNTEEFDKQWGSNGQVKSTMPSVDSVVTEVSHEDDDVAIPEEDFTAELEDLKNQL